MANTLKQRSVHANKLDRWLGKDKTEEISFLMRDWYGPPIAVGGVQGFPVWAHKGGDFRGVFGAGQFGNQVDYWKEKTAWFAKRVARRQRATAHAGFSSISDLVAEATAGKQRDWHWSKNGTTGVVGATNSLWRVGTQPAAGAAASAAPGGIAPTDATTGAYPFDNVSADTRHIVSGYAISDQARTLLLYDRIFAVAKTMSSTGTESVTGVPTRYQSSTPSAADYAGGNFIFIECGTALGATAHNWTVCQYRNQAGTDAQTLPSVTGNASCIVNRLDMPLSTFFCPLATGDTGAMDLAQMQCSASVTGAIDFVIGHVIAWMPVATINILSQYDFVRGAFTLARIFDDAALAWLNPLHGSTTASNFLMGITAVHG